MKANFKDVDSGKLYYISSYSTRFVEGRLVNVYRNTPLVGDKGTPLESIAKDDQEAEADEILANGVSLTESKAGYDKRINHFKQRAKEHARSDDGKHTRQKVIDKQFGVMGLERKKK